MEGIRPANLPFANSPDDPCAQETWEPLQVIHTNLSHWLGSKVNEAGFWFCFVLFFSSVPVSTPANPHLNIRKVRPPSGRGITCQASVRAHNFLCDFQQIFCFIKFILAKFAKIANHILILYVQLYSVSYLNCLTNLK